MKTRLVSVTIYLLFKILNQKIVKGTCYVTVNRYCPLNLKNFNASTVRILIG